MSPDKAVEERVGIVEAQYEIMERRVGRIEYVLFGLLATAIATLVSIWIKK